MIPERRLVSLWDIMKQFDAALFLALSRNLETIAGLPDDSTPLPERTKVAGIYPFTCFRDDCIALGLTASARSVEKILKVYSKNTCETGEFRTLAIELQGRLIDEMRGRIFFSLTGAEAELYVKWWVGWEKIVTRFGNTTRDIEEMNKCFAFSRYTASMFHALHVAEWGAIELGNYIGVADPKKGWAPTERKLTELIKAGHAQLPSYLSGKFEFIEQMGREIDSMVLAWRHKVDHAANHLAIVPDTEFTEDIAEHIIGSVKVFMNRLIEGIP
jgi:hypothetical protein